MLTGSSSFNAGSAQDAVVRDVRARFTKFVGVVGRPFGVDLPLPSLPSDSTSCLSFLKKFCGGFLECPKTHLWHRPTMHLSSDSRKSIAMSLFLHRKVLPSEPSDLRSYALKMSEDSPPCDQGFLRYVRKHTARMFPVGWDRSLYVNSALNSVLPLTCCREASRKAGGCRMAGLDSAYDAWNDRASFVEHVLVSCGYKRLRPSKVISVETGGKHRTVSVPEIGMNDLRPLHSSIYNHIARFPWLLRGDAKPSRFSSFTRVRGEVFVSGDYESATDNLSQPIQKAIMESILLNSSVVPEFIKARAMNSLSMDLEVDGELFHQRRGQLMGNLVSFPLLCIVNYLAFRWVAGPECPVKVNGDDIVFRSTRTIADRWMSEVSRAGLTLSRGKTSVDPVYFSLNSRLFRSGFSKVRIVPCLRSSAFFGLREGVDSLTGRAFSFCEGFSPSRRSILRTEFLRWNRRHIESSRRSITRGLGIGFTYGEILSAGLWDREAWYLSFESERPLPLLDKAVDARFIPEGWHFVRVEKLTKEIRRVQRELGPLFVEGAWNRPRLVDVGKVSKTDLLREGTLDWYSWRNERCRDLKRRSRLLGLSPQNTVRYLRPSFSGDVQRRFLQCRWRRFTILTEKAEPRRLLPHDRDDVDETIVTGCRNSVALPPPSCLL